MNEARQYRASKVYGGVEVNIQRNFRLNHKLGYKCFPSDPIGLNWVKS